MINGESILTELERFIYRELVESHGEKVALGCAQSLFDCLFLNFRYQAFYVPTSDKLALVRRYASIWQEFNGSNHKELAIKHRLSVTRIYMIIRKQRAKSLIKIAPGEKHSEDLRDKPLVLWVIEEYLPADLVECGLAIDEATTLAQKIAVLLCDKFPGIQTTITGKMKSDRDAARKAAA